MNAYKLPWSAKAFWLLVGLAAAAPITNASVHVQRLRSFGFPLAQFPEAPVIQGADGALYGTASMGGSSSGGTVFMLHTDGSGYTDLHHFNGVDGRSPQAELLEGSDGFLYGSTDSGGAHTNQYGQSGGVLYKLKKDGADYTVLHHFGRGSDGSQPRARLLEASDGALYGTTLAGGTHGKGTVFRLKKDGSQFIVLYNFWAAALIEGSDGALYTTSSRMVLRLSKDGSSRTVLFTLPDSSSLAPLVQASDGRLYGTTVNGGTYTNQYGISGGTVFRLNLDGSGYSVLHNFGGSIGDGMGPNGLLEGSDGALYGTTYLGGTNLLGVVFKLNKDGSGHRILSFFDRPYDRPTTPLVEGNDGGLYGSTRMGGANGLGVVFKLSTDGSSKQIIHEFANDDGRGPDKVIEGSDGLLYGLTSAGGPYSDGTVFRLHRDGSGYRLLYNFGASALDGASPNGLIEAKDGALYGTTAEGGASLHSDQSVFGFGTVFKLSKDGTEYKLLHNFAGSALEGVYPIGLIEGSDGALYGRTQYGGEHANAFGTIFKLNTNGTGYTVLHNFSRAEGLRPQGSVIEGSDRALYGTTASGGAYTNRSGWSFGTVFKVNLDGSGYTVLHNFRGSQAGDGAFPSTRLLQARDGGLYGATTGEHGFLGTGWFRLNKDGSGYKFVAADYREGVSNYEVLAEGRNGTVYGTSFNPDYGCGAVVSISKGATSYHTLFQFPFRDGCEPTGGLVLGKEGVFYGATRRGGDLDFGTLFKFWPPETPDLIAATAVSNAVQVTFAGVAGYQYQVLRSTDLTGWRVATTITMPSSGTYTHLDNLPLRGGTYYRAAWIPEQ